MFGLYAALCLAGVLVVFNLLMGYSSGEFGKATVALGALACLPALAVFAVLLPRWKSRPERVFLLVATPALLAFAFFMMIGQVPDEINHIKRAFTLEQPGNDMMIPASIASGAYPATYAELAERLASSQNLSDLVSGDYKMAAYLPHLYVVPYLVMKAATTLGINLYTALYLGRIANIALYLVGGYWVIRLMPLGRVFMMVYLLNPMILQQQASLSADAITNIVTLLYIALVLRARFSDKVSKKLLVAIGVTFVIAALSKYIYALLIYLLLLLVPKIQDRRRRMAVYGGTAAFTCIALFCALFVVSWGENQSTFDLMKDPVNCLRILKNTVVLIGPSWVTMFFGGVLGSLNIPMWTPAVWAYALVFAFSLVFNLGESNTLKRYEKICIVTLTIVVTAMFTLLFRNWSMTADGNFDFITGVQGRYFLPFINVALVCCSSPRASLVRENCLVFYAIAVLFVVASDMLSVIAFFA